VVRYAVLENQRKMKMAGCEVSGFKKSSPLKRSKQEALQITKNHYNNETDIVITNIIK
jgi:hypothetical protein